MRALPVLETHTPTGSLAPALAVSVALHVAVIAGVPDFSNYAADVPRSPLAARLVLLDAPRDVTMPVVPPPPESRPLQPVSAPRPAVRAPVEQPARGAAAAQPVARTAPAPVPERPQSVEKIAPAPRDAPAAPSVAATSHTAEPAAVTGSAAGEPSLEPRVAPEAIDPGSLAQYRLALIGAARRDKAYPDLARSRGLEGRVAVELVIGADGALASSQVRQSSGHDVLDRQALEMLRRAAARTPVPPSLQSREFRLDVPVLFELRSG